MYIDVVACAGPEVHVLHTNRFDREQAVTYLKAVGNALTTIFIRQESKQKHAVVLQCLHNPRCLYKYPLTATKVSFTSLGKWNNIYQVRIQYYLEKFIL